MGRNCLVLAAVLLVVIAGVGLVLRGAVEGTRASTNVLISGIVPCSTGSTIDEAAAPVFAHAGLLLECGGKVVAGATTDDAGTFQINLGSVASDLLNGLLDDQCKVVVITPLAACNVSLAGVTGMLTAPLKLLGTDGSGHVGGLGRILVHIVGGLISGILNLVPQPFSLA